MTRRQADRWLRKFLDRLAEVIGFEHRADFLLAKDIDINTTYKLTWGIRVDGYGVGLISYGAGIRFERIEHFLRTRDDFTFCMPHHLIEQDVDSVKHEVQMLDQDNFQWPDYFEWPVSNHADELLLLSRIVAHISNVALPFLSQYQSMRAIERRLESEDRNDWLLMGPEDRIMRLAAIMTLTGRAKDAAELIHHQIIASCKTCNPYYKPIDLQACLRKIERFHREGKKPVP